MLVLENLAFGRSALESTGNSDLGTEAPEQSDEGKSATLV
jgi:hypothetical protein